MKTRQLVSTALVAMACFAGAASAQNLDRRGPNVMPAPNENRNYSDNTNAYDVLDLQSRRAPNVMQAPDAVAEANRVPRTRRAPAAETEPQAAPGTGEHSGPNIVGDPLPGFPAPAAGGNPGRGGEARSPAPGCDKCIAI
jgi:hypothetical protein